MAASKSMQRWTAVLGVLLVIAVAMVVVNPALRFSIGGYLSGEPFFRGRSASYWNDRLDREGVFPGSKAVRLLNAGGSDSIPVILYICQLTNNDNRRGIIFEMGERAVPALQREIENDDAEIRLQASLCLYRLSLALDLPEDRQRSIAALCGLLGEVSIEDRWPDVAKVVADIGPDARAAAPQLIQLLQANDPRLRKYAADGMRGIATPEDQAAIPALRDLAADPDPFSRFCALAALRKISPADPQLLPDYLAAMEYPYSPVRIAAADAVADYGNAAQSAVPLLVAGMSDPDIEVQFSCALALVAIGELDAATTANVATILQMQFDDETATTDVRQRAAAALELIGK